MLEKNLDMLETCILYCIQAYGLFTLPLDHCTKLGIHIFVNHILFKVVISFVRVLTAAHDQLHIFVSHMLVCVGISNIFIWCGGFSYIY